MKTISYKLKDLDQKEKKVTLKLGYVGENEHVQIRIDCSEIWENYPNAVASLAVEPPEGSKYPAIVTREGNVVCWTVKDSDVVHDGYGRIQLTFTEGSEIQKTVICRTKVDESIIGSGTAPDPIADFVAEANEALAELEAAEVHGPVIGEDGYWYTWSKDAGEYVKTDTKAQGEDGQQGPAGKDGKDGKDGADGAPGQDGHTPVKGTDYWTQQDQADIVAAAALETVSAVIDDTAGDGDTNKTWSADKISETTGQLLTAIDGIEDDVEDIDEILNGTEAPPSYSLPTGYQSANYSNAAGTNKFKYVDGKLELAKVGTSSGSITTSNAGLTINEALMFKWADHQDATVKIDYNNPNVANAASINFRFYDEDINYNTATIYKLPVGVGTIEVKILDIVAAAESPVTAEGKPYVIIRDISLLSGFESYQNVSATIYGFGTSGGKTGGLIDRVDNLEEDLKNINNLYEELYEDLGYPDSETGDLYLYNSTNIEKTSKFISVTAGDILHIQAWASGDPHGRIAYYDSSKQFISSEDIVSADRTSTYAHADITVPTRAGYIRFGYYSFGNGKAMITPSIIKTGFVPALVDTGSKVFNSADNYYIKGINHRGYNTVAPENTVPAFIMSAKNGFAIVETDVNFTYDNVPVLLHDTTINRTARNADGTEISSTIAINDITYDEALTYDFGIWKGSTYAGTKIPTFEEFIILCKRIGLHPYIELKNDVQYTEAQILSLIAIVRKYDMEQNCTWISFALNPLYVIKRNAPYCRIGYIVSEITNKRITETLFLRTQYNETFIDGNVTNITSELVALVKAAGVPLEVYSINMEAAMLDLDEYISGVTSDVYNFPDVVKDSILGN